MKMLIIIQVLQIMLNQVKFNTNNVKSSQMGKSTNQNYFLQSSNTFKETKEKPKKVIKQRPNSVKPSKPKTKPDSNTNVITISLAEPFLTSPLIFFLPVKPSLLFLPSR